METTMDRLESMSILVAAVEAGSLSAAARRLGTPLATVSRKISALEAHLKARLLNRSNRKLTLTDAGRSYVTSCRRILEDIGESERRTAGFIRDLSCSQDARRAFRTREVLSAQCLQQTSPHGRLRRNPFRI